MASYNLNDVILFRFQNKSGTVSAEIKGSIIAILRDKDDTNDIKAYSISVNPKDIPEEVKALNLKLFTEAISHDDLSYAKSNGREIFTSLPDIVGKVARWVKPELMIKLLKSENDDEKELRRQINFFFKDILTEYVAPGDSGLKYL